MLYDDDLILMSETIEGLRIRFLKWKVAFESRGLNINFGKTKVSSGITKDGMCKCTVNPCGICSLRVNDNTALCVQCGKWINGRWPE